MPKYFYRAIVLTGGGTGALDAMSHTDAAGDDSNIPLRYSTRSKDQLVG